MKLYKQITTALLLGALCTQLPNRLSAEESMDKMWGETKSTAAKAQVDVLSRGPSLRDGRYGLFIHWGLFSSLGGTWKDKTYYGIGEWIMNSSMANIPPGEYMDIAKTFNPEKFDAKAIVKMAKDAGMKYVIITSKHHEGFAMFKTKHPFNIVDASPFHRDPMGELADACRAAGLGFGFYYSHYQDWTSPGAHNGPKTNPDGSVATFEQYFREKCYPQVKEICTQYGPLDVIWFDTPGSMPKEDVIALHDLVRATQPRALLNSRIGYGLGDYECQGDMEIPVEKISGFWETCDTTNDSWSYAWYDNNWKSPKTIIQRLIATTARGGNYLLNVGPDGQGVVPATCQQFLKESGEWLKAHPSLVYGALPSPWRFAMPWGDITQPSPDVLNLVVFNAPADGYIYLPGLSTAVQSAKVVNQGKTYKVKTEVVGQAVRVQLPEGVHDPVGFVVEVKLKGAAVVDQTVALHPNTSNEVLAHFAEAVGCEKGRVGWMEKFGEWKHVQQVAKWTPAGVARWTVNVLEAGHYDVALRYRGKLAEKSKAVWKITTDDGAMLQNQQSMTTQYQFYPMGVMEFKTTGKHVIEVSLVEGEPTLTSLEAISLTRSR